MLDLDKDGARDRDEGDNGIVITDGPALKSANGSSSRRSEGGEFRGGDTGEGGSGLTGILSGIAGGREKVEVVAAAECDRTRVDCVGDVSVEELD